MLRRLALCALFLTPTLGGGYTLLRSSPAYADGDGGDDGGGDGGGDSGDDSGDEGDDTGDDDTTDDDGLDGLDGTFEGGFFSDVAGFFDSIGGFFSDLFSGGGMPSPAAMSAGAVSFAMGAMNAIGNMMGMGQITGPGLGALSTSITNANISISQGKDVGQALIDAGLGGLLGLAAGSPLGTVLGGLGVGIIGPPNAE